MTIDYIVLPIHAWNTTIQSQLIYYRISLALGFCVLTTHLMFVRNAGENKRYRRAEEVCSYGLNSTNTLRSSTIFYIVYFLLGIKWFLETRTEVSFCKKFEEGVASRALSLAHFPTEVPSTCLRRSIHVRSHALFSLLRYYGGPRKFRVFPIVRKCYSPSH